MKTIRDFIEGIGITATAVRTDRNPHMQYGSGYMDHWRVTLRRPDTEQRLTVYFSMGSGHHGKEPDAAGVLDCLASDSAGIENARDFEDWCSDYGYDTDSRKAHKTWTACQRQADHLKAFMGTQYQALLFETERL